MFQVKRMVNTGEILSGAAHYVKEFFRVHHDPKLVYHNLAHTEQVVERSAEIAAHYPLSSEEIFVLLSAAWFHDVGHLIHQAEGHEESSIAVMENYFKNTGVPADAISTIAHCIRLTRLPAAPTNLLGKILCDADLYHLGTDRFLITNDLVKKEIELRNNIELKNWDKASLVFLRTQQFFTTYCQQLLEAGKHENIVLLEQQINEP